MITRRDFIRNTTFASVAAVLSPRMLKAADHKKDVGLQLYSVRDHLATDFKGTLRKLKKMGYTWLEAAGYGDGKFYGLPPAEFKKEVDRLGMKVISSHAMFTEDKQEQAIAAHSELGVEYLIFPGFPVPEHKTKDDFLNAAARLNKIGDACNKSGIKFGYHNHEFEFVQFDNNMGFDIMLTSTDPQKVCFESDIYWMIYAGVDPLKYFRDYPGRFELWHVKDMKDAPDRGFTEVGDGTIPYDEIFKYSGISGMKYFFIEQDDCDMDSLLSVRISYNNVKDLLNYQLYGE
jgi:sugar phosphate isomerase/epimerase